MKKTFTFLMIFSFNMAFSQSCNLNDLMFLSKSSYQASKQFLKNKRFVVESADDSFITWIKGNNEQISISKDNWEDDLYKRVNYHFNSASTQADISGDCFQLPKKTDGMGRRYFLKNINNRKYCIYIENGRIKEYYVHIDIYN
jgi:hypothetical protein